MKKILFLVLVLSALLGFDSVLAAGETIYSAGKQGELSLYISPSEKSHIVATIPACIELEVLEKNGTWGLVKVNNKCGWINLSFTRKTYNDAAEYTGDDSKKSVTVKSTGGKAGLYSMPTDDLWAGSEELFKVPDGTVLGVTRETKTGWSLVSMNGEYSWIKSENVTFFTEEINADKYGIYYVYVLSENGNGTALWTNTDKKTKVAVIPDCVRLTVQETEGNYALVSHDGASGWIDLRETTESLLNAQSGAGKEVNREFTLVPPIGESIKVLSVPSEKECDGAEVMATIEKESVFFVLRTTMDGWGLIYCDGQLGWVKPEVIFSSDEGEAVHLVLEKPEKGFVFTEKYKGMTLFSKPDGKTKTAIIPEFVGIDVLAKKDGYIFVSCDYACGWAKEEEFVFSTEKIIEEEQEKKSRYILKNDSVMMSLPTGEMLCHSEIVKNLDKKTEFECIKIVATGKEKWAFVRIDGQEGWINLNDARKVIPGYVIALIVFGVILVICGVIYVIRFLFKKKYRKSETEGEMENEAWKGLHNADSGTYEESPDVSHK